MSTNNISFFWTAPLIDIKYMRASISPHKNQFGPNKHPTYTLHRLQNEGRSHNSKQEKFKSLIFIFEDKNCLDPIIFAYDKMFNKVTQKNGESLE